MHVQCADAILSFLDSVICPLVEAHKAHSPCGSKYVSNASFGA